MTNIFVSGGRTPAIPVVLVGKASYSRVKKKLPQAQQHWLDRNDFSIKSGKLCALPDSDGEIERYLCAVPDLNDPFAIADLPMRLPVGLYQLEGSGVKNHLVSLATGWGLGSYQFSRYKKPRRMPAQLKLPSSADLPRIHEITEATRLVRDLINTPAEDMMPQHLAETVETLAKNHGAQFAQIVGEDLLAENYPCIHTVGRASVHPPRLLDLRWGNESDPKITLVGKGISFDSGGLDIKPAAGMRSMKKDMGGAAHAIGLAQLIMSLDLPVRLRLMVASAENAISANSFRPGDVITTRAGITVEIDNTDAEGRLVLCDALAEASGEEPQLMVDFATLTGAARVAVGTEMAAFFSSSPAVATQLYEAADRVSDPVWQLPLYKGYLSFLKSHVADLQNAASTPLGGAITAALYLQKFVAKKIDWLHFDIMAWNIRNRPGRPVGGEAMGLRAMFEMLEQRYRQ